ncbi:hypothetical protein GCM10009113_09870 [Marinobacter szutsaonensis]
MINTHQFISAEENEVLAGTAEYVTDNVMGNTHLTGSIPVHDFCHSACGQVFPKHVLNGPMGDGALGILRCHG